MSLWVLSEIDFQGVATGNPGPICAQQLPTPLWILATRLWLLVVCPGPATLKSLFCMASFLFLEQPKSYCLLPDLMADAALGNRFLSVGLSSVKALNGGVGAADPSLCLLLAWCPPQRYSGKSRVRSSGHQEWYSMFL